MVDEEVVDGDYVEGLVMGGCGVWWRAEIWRRVSVRATVRAREWRSLTEIHGYLFLFLFLSLY